MLALLTLLCFVACNLQSSPEYILNYSADDVLSEEEYIEIETYVNNLYPDFLDTDLVYYEQNPETFNQFMSIGFKGVPVIIDRMKFIEENPEFVRTNWYGKYYDGIAGGVYRYASFLAVGIRGVTRTAKYFCMFDDESHPKISGVATTQYCFFLYAKKRIPEIINSDAETHEKLKELSVFGVYALPYVLAQIEQGNVEYEEYFIYIGLHLSDREYMEIASKNTVTIDYYVYDFYTDDLNNQISTILSTGNPNNFDYKAWLNENENDLNILYKYADDFCAEYEAKQKAE